MHSVWMGLLILGADAAPAAAPEEAGSLSLVFAAILLACAAALFFLEIFIPSMGLLTVCGIACAVGSVWLGFRHGTGTGLLVLLLNAALLPCAIIFAFKMLPKSPVVLEADAVGGKPDEIPDDAAHQALVGKSGAAVTDLRPAGKAAIEGKRVDVLTEGGFISRGARVTVVRVEGNRIFVRQEKA